MVVTKITVSNGTWTVTRPNPVSHPLLANDPLPLVMYTPLNTFTTQPVCTRAECPYSIFELAKSCLTSDSTDGAYKVIGIGDPVFSGGE